MTEQEQIEEMAKEIFNSGIAIRVSDLAYGLIDSDDNFHRLAKYLYNAGYCKTFTSDLASDTQKAFKDGYSKGVDYGIEFGKVLLYKTRKETAREIFGELREFVENRKHRFDLECNEAEKVAKSYNEDERGREIFTKILHKKDGAWVECDVIELKIDNLAEKYGVEVEE